jgi:hypothetical protein
VKVTVLFVGCKVEEYQHQHPPRTNGRSTLTSTSVASASMTDTLRDLCRVMYRVGWIIERGFKVPTATLGKSGVNRK